MLENNNKKIVGKLAKRSFFKNKLRNIAAVTAIALTALLFTSIITIGINGKEIIHKSNLQFSLKNLVKSRAHSICSNY